MLPSTINGNLLSFAQVLELDDHIRMTSTLFFKIQKLPGVRSLSLCKSQALFIFLIFIF